MKEINKLLDTMSKLTEQIAADPAKLISAEADTAAKCFDEMTDHFTRNIAKRQQSIKESQQADRARLEELAERKAKLVDQISEAYSSEDIDTAHMLETQLEELAKEEYGAKQRANTVLTLTVRGDKRIFKDVYKTYVNTLETRQETGESLEQLRADLLELADKLRHYADKLKTEKERFSNAGMTYIESRMIEITEKVTGPLNVAGADGANTSEAFKKIILHSTPEEVHPSVKNTAGLAAWLKLLNEIR